MKNKLMDSKYDHHTVELGKYDEWKSKGYFTSGDKNKKPYAMVIPPPNVTGKLHIGHAFDTSLQDIIIRRKRMQGYDACWVPGMDHAGIATQAKVDAKLKANGISRYDLGREKFLGVAWEWKKEYAEFIHAQWKALGLSVDYTKERFTLDEGLQEAVQKVFIDLYNEGLLYRGERIINWDCEAKTALSNIEVEYKDIEGAFYYFKYPFVNHDGGLVIATTRPETMFADQALMVHPNDERYQKYIGEKVFIPNTNIQIPVISDDYVDMEFGSGVVKVTPAHDPNDFEVGVRHKLDRPLCMNEDGTMNEMALKYAGLNRFECRKMLVKDLTELGLCEKVEKMIHSVGHSERTGVVVEPRLSKQWFVKMAPLAKDVLDMQAGNEGISFIPPRFNKTLTSWLDEDTIQDWCVSRQLWWGHRIPAWYNQDEVRVSIECPGEGFVQDEDVLDTWFSSALWPFSTLGWPNDSADFERYFPTDCLVTGYDIIFFWVARMAFQSRHFTGKRPFKECFIHGLIRDSEGRKMSKSLGNGIDPFDLIEQYGCDAMRYFLTTNATPGQDLRYSDEKMASSWNYINKIWNISRYIQLNISQIDLKDDLIDYQNLTAIDEVILSKTNELIESVDKCFDAYELGEVAKLIYNFVYDDFASNYLEMTKVTFASGDLFQHENTGKILKYVLSVIVKLLHPFMPFVTEEIYNHFFDGSIMISNWPEKLNISFDENTISNCNILYEVIKTTRQIRSEKSVPMSKKINLMLEIKDLSTREFFKKHLDYLQRFVNFDGLTIEAVIDKTDSAVVVLTSAIVIIPLKELINIEEELTKLHAAKAKLENEVKRSQNMLNNPNFINKAPAQKVQIEKDKLTEYLSKLEEVNNLIGSYE